TRWPRDWSSDVCSSDLSLDSLSNNLVYVNGKSASTSISSHFIISNIKQWPPHVYRPARPRHLPLRPCLHQLTPPHPLLPRFTPRSEERRVGKECNSRSD